MVLDLYVHQKQGLPTSVTSAYAAARVGNGTGHRMIEALGQDGWLVRRADVQDKRRTWMSLSVRALHRLDLHFDLLWANLPRGE
jgi:DNA-binding MarR family transcriptional regulator